MTDPLQAAGPVHRVAARLLPVSARGEVLLLQGQDPARPGELHWVSIGGAVEAGESVPDAAVREMREETGLVVDVSRLVGPIHRATHPFSWDGRDYVSDNHFWAVALELDLTVADAVSLAGLEAAEVGNVFGAAWWTPEALRADGSGVTEDLPDIMEAAIAAVRTEREDVT